MPMMRTSMLLSLLVVWISPVEADERVVPVLTNGNLQDWHEQVFSNHTVYQRELLDGRVVLKARSHGAASGMIRHMDVDINKTPRLHWSWKIDAPVQGNAETTRQGDDYVARVYVVASDAVFFWRTRAISYVWSSAMPKGSSWPNAYTANTMMLAIESGSDLAGKWVAESRDVRQDFNTLHGMDIDHIDAVAIMSDTDNTGQSVTAYYGDISFAPRLIPGMQ